MYQPVWAERVIRVINPTKYIDIGSTLNFCSILSVFVDTNFYDYRPTKLKLTNLTFGQTGLTNLTFKTNCIESLSCMQTIEHIGHGYYGDKIFSQTKFEAIKNSKRVYAQNGSSLIVVPIERRKIQLNTN